MLAALGGVLLNVLASRIGYILAAMGLGIVAYAGLTVLALELVDLLNDNLAGIGSVTIMGQNVGAAVVQVVSKAGLFDALNIIVAAWLTRISMIAAVIHLQRVVAS